MVIQPIGSNTSAQAPRTSNRVIQPLASPSTPILQRKEPQKPQQKILPQSKQLANKPDNLLTSAKSTLENLGVAAGRKLQKVPNLDLGTKGQKFFQATDTETQILDFISNFPSGIAQSWGQSIEQVSTDQGREKLKADAKNLPKTMSEVKTHLENKEWQKALDAALTNSALTVALDASDVIPTTLLAKFGLKGIKASAKQSAQQIVKEAVEETEKQAVKTIEKPKTVERYIVEPRNAQESANLKYVKENPQKVVQDYEKRVIQEYGTPNVITADEGKYVLPGYEGRKAPEYHEAASGLAQHIYDEKLISRKGQGNNTVLFTAGGTGSGKTSALRNAGTDFKDYSIIYDTNLTGKKAAEKIQKALDGGYKVQIAYVQRNPIKAFEEGVLPRVRTRNRIVSIDEHIERHKALENVIELKKQFGNKIDVRYIDNTGVKGTQKVVSFAELPKFKYNDSTLRKVLNESLDKAIKAGKITSEEGLAIRKAKQVGSKVRRSPEQKSLSRREARFRKEDRNSTSQKSPQREVKPKEVSVPHKEPIKIGYDEQIKNVKDIKDVKTTIRNIRSELDDALAEAEGKAVVAQEKRAGLNTANIAKLKRIYAINKKFKEGDIETLRKSKSGKLLNEVIENVQEVYPNMDEKAAFDFALGLPTKADEVAINPNIRELIKKEKALRKYLDLLRSKQNELKIKEDDALSREWQEALAIQEKLKRIVGVPRSQLPVGEGKEKLSRLEARVTESLEKAPEDVRNLSTYQQMNKKEQIAKASKYVSESPDEAMAVLRGEKEAPEGLLYNSIYVAMQNMAQGDVALARKLASLRSTRYGKEISILTEIDPNSPVKIMKEIVEVREEAFKKRYGGRSPEEMTKKVIGDIQKRVKVPDKYDWNKFVDSIQC